MKIIISDSKQELGRQAAQAGAELIRQALRENGEANIVVATGASQFEMLGELVAAPDIDWSQITAFHLDEYVGMPISHGASFRRYLKERFVDQLSQPLRAFNYINAETDAPAECERLSHLIMQHPIDVAFIGIGENGHLAFNDPPADFETEKPYIVVNLDEACRRQQVGEGWFPSMDDVPTQAISMSIRQIMKSQSIICSVPDERKAEAVKGAAEGPVSEDLPASILQQHPATKLYLDRESASLLSQSY
ncbi:MAG: glucosamine-6-phosphate deaminase [Abitibacteriaceae bacterium]|nr:glucosamine-6-phosphate deaminase [Abditibacteriaceae bacterium]MBV9866024.1 glucosamine-6-phosphate deaminase [Abditibacteriaceae bacterium]